MDLKRITIKNYRQYRDVEIIFEPNPDKNFTIIQGNNGTGKTTFLNALSWCLYGEEIHDYRDDSSMDICNNKSLKLADNHSNIDVIVEMEFLDDGNQRLIFRRSKTFHKTSDDLIAGSVFGDEFVVIQPDSDNPEPNPNIAHYMVENKIPKEIEDYFFFDGARLAEYFQATSNQNIKDAILELSQLNLVTSLTSNLNKVTNKYIEKQKKLSPQVGEANEKIAQITNKIKHYEFSYKNSEEAISKAEERIKEIERELIDSNATEIKMKVERDKTLKTEISKDSKKLEKAQEKRRKLILKNYPYILSYEYFNNFLKYGESSRKKGYIPPKFKRGFLEDLLNQNKCICGCDLKEDTGHRKAIEKLLEETSPLTDMSEEITTALAHVKETILVNIENFKDQLQPEKDKIKEYSEKVDAKSEERKQIKAFLKNFSEKRVNELTEEKESLEKDIRKHERNMGKCENEITRLKGELGKWNKVKASEDGIQIELDELDDKIEFCRKAMESAEIVEKTLVNAMKDNIEELTKEKFLNIQWKDDEFVDIRMNRDYGVFIKNRTGKEERPGDLSDGEKLCLGLCFMSALHNISGFELPIVMDTPLGVLDKDLRNNLAKSLPEFMDGKQIIMLVTSTEYTDEFRNPLINNLEHEYTIKWNNSEDGKESEVI